MRGVPIIHLSVVGSAILAVLGCSGIAGGPAFRVVNHGTSDCSTLGDVCARMTCSIANNGSEAGVAAVSFSMFDPNGSVVKATEMAEVKPGEVAAVSHDFSEVRWGGLDKTRVECAVSAR